MYMISLVMGVVIWAGMVHAVSLEEIQAAVQQRGAAWIPGRNDVWNKSDTEKQSLVGTILEGRNPPTSNTTGTLQSLPAYFDWRDAGVVTSVKDQGKCGGCWAFATVGELESLLLITGQAKESVEDLSEQFLISYNLSNRGCNGGILSRAADFLEKTGTISESCKPYKASNAKLPPPCSNWKAELETIETWTSVPRTVEDLKAAVYQRPVATGFYVYTDFYSYTGGVYSYVTGKHEGGHAVLVVGWDDSNQCFIVKNSWGTGWGEGGYFRIAYTEMNSKVEFGTDSVLFDPVLTR